MILTALLFLLPTVATFTLAAWDSSRTATHQRCDG